MISFKIILLMFDFRIYELALVHWKHSRLSDCVRTRDCLEIVVLCVYMPCYDVNKCIK